MSRVALVAGLVAALAICAEPGLAVRCTPAEVERIESGRPGTLIMWNYYVRGRDEARSGAMASADKTWRAAYNYMRAHCYEIRYDALQQATQSVLDGQLKAAFRSFPMIPAGQRWPDYEAAGVIKPYNDAILDGQIGHFSQAARELPEALLLNDRYQGLVGGGGLPDGHVLLGMAYEGLGRRAMAIEQWRYALMAFVHATPEPENFGPDDIWLMALKLYGVQKLGLPKP